MKKTMCELFAGVGGFRLGFDRLKSGWETVWFSQYEPGAKTQHAYNCYVNHFGNCTDLNGEITTGNDISTVDKNVIPDHSLLTAGFPCFPGETLILTKKGLKRIDEIKINDEVLSHDNEYHKVTNTFNQGIKETYTIKGYAFDSIRATKNHKFYIRKKHNRKMCTPEWMSIEEIMNCKDKIYFGNAISDKSIIPQWDGVELAFNKTKTETVNTLDMSDESLWYLVGCYLGDGWLRKQQKDGEKRYKYNGIVIGCNPIKKEKISKRIQEKFHFTTDNVNDTNVKMIFSNCELASFMELFGNGAENKQLPGFVFDMPVNLLKALFDGYIDTDGCFIKNYYQISTISQKLAYGITTIYEKIYHKPCKIYLTKTKDKTIIEGRVVNQKDYYLIRCVTEQKHITAFYEDNYIWYPIKEIVPYKKEQVYDIAVDDSHSFVANRAVAHNCQDYSIARSKVTAMGIEGKKGVLWWQIYETLLAKNTPFCLFENVDRLVKSPAKQRGRDFGIMLTCLNNLGYIVEWRIVNASSYGAGQRRKRTYIFAYKDTTKYYNKLKKIPLEKIVEEKGFFANVFKISEVIQSGTTVLPKDITKASDTFSFNFENAGVMKDGKVYTAKIKEECEPSILLGSLLESDVDKKYYITPDKMKKWVYLKGAKKIPRKAPNGHEYIYSEGPVPFPDEWDKPARTILTSEAVVSRTSHAVKDPKTEKLRILTPRETERIQGFDDNWTDTGMTERMRYFCMGNALVVPMVTRMAKEIDSIIKKEK